MEIKKTLILDCAETASKAIPRLMDVPAVIVTRNGKYLGLIDHRSFAGQGIRDTSVIKCENVIVKPPVLTESAGVIELIGAFMLGHFKALPIVGDNDRPLGITTRVELVKELLSEKLIPAESVPELMSSPVYIIAANDTLGAAMGAMKEKNTNKLVVMANGYPIGIVSDFDIGSWVTRSNIPSDRKNREQTNINVADLRISEFLRPDITTMEQSATMQEAMERMVQKGVSAVVVTANKKPVGVLSALDIFKRIREMAEAPDGINISGLSGDNAGMYPHMSEKIGHVLGKFTKTFTVSNVNVHVKEQKSTFTVSVHLDTEEGPLSIKEERKSLRETVDEVASELEKALRKRKDMRKAKPRATSY
ncbi:MAG: CBS domain-containing protein [Candidatus ainarchaeum sp.]|nr:CBS domain-containing protein [Candidatus ainarchaeum sp.]